MEEKLTRKEEPNIQKYVDGYILRPECMNADWKVKVEMEGDIAKFIPIPHNTTLSFECKCGYVESFSFSFTLNFGTGFAGVASQANPRIESEEEEAEVSPSGGTG